MLYILQNIYYLCADFQTVIITIKKYKDKAAKIIKNN